MKIVCDIDGILASTVEHLDYSCAVPIRDNISLINKLYSAGHTIVLFTARGTETGIDWRSQTVKQMARFGVSYHELLFGKPAADYYLDDKNTTIENLKELLRETRYRRQTP